ncbi:pathogenesis-related protein PR-1 type-like [Bradysia coprophila]|uniref:pathogenesis-related protein PR-1 type-like n=1 Tax=Bradysia coprophila TaxID=38358 RepID=UPI00187D7B0A|nr:pathogenesis-related protein PR-1 type-like [Bradysia coprophila]
MWRFCGTIYIFLAVGVSTLLGSKLSEDQKLYVDEHNTYRSGANPSASNMKQMEWNSTLASLAKEWASRCVFEHGHPENNINEWIGQNLFWSSYPDNIIVNAIRAWHFEASDYDFNSNTCASDKVCGHYTQVMWANSYKIGCALSPPECENGYILVCNYLPGGNYAGEKPYKKGASCTQCEMGWQGGCDKNLCTRGDRPMSNPIEEISKVFADSLQEMFKPK